MCDGQKKDATRIEMLNECSFLVQETS